MASCKHATQFKEVLAPGLFTMQVPAYMNATSELFPGGKACMQYENDSLQVYMLVFDSTRKDITENTLKSFYDSVATQPSMQDAKLSPAQLTTVDHDSAMISEMSGTQGNTKIYYRIEVIATPARFYYMLIWCKEADKEAHKADFEKILHSFTDINHAKT
jgi:hypothetical protein